MCTKKVMLEMPNVKAINILTLKNVVSVNDGKALLQDNEIDMQDGTIYTAVNHDSQKSFICTDNELKSCHIDTCSVCNRELYYISDITTGFATNREGKKVCFDCCGESDKETLLTAFPGYVKATCLYYDSRKQVVANWCNTLEIPTQNNVKGKHNIARTRWGFTFTLNKQRYSGYCLGDSMVANIRKLK